MPTIKNQGTKIHYQFHPKPNIHYVKIYIDELNGIQVTASISRDFEKVEAFILKKVDWILKKWQMIHSSLYSINQITLEPGQKITYLGRSYQLIIEESEEDQAAFNFHKGKFHFTYPPKMNDKDILQQLNLLLESWLVDKAHKKFDQLHHLNIIAEEDSIRLGALNNEIVSLNWRLIQQPKKSIQDKINQLIEGEYC